MLPDFLVEIFWCPHYEKWTRHTRDYEAPGCADPIEEKPTPEEIALATRQGSNQDSYRKNWIELGVLPSGDPDPQPEDWVAKRIEWQKEKWDWAMQVRGSEKAVLVSWSIARQKWVKVTFFPSGTLPEEILVETPSAEEIEAALWKALAQ
jgi:hypothetical protein